MAVVLGQPAERVFEQTTLQSAIATRPSPLAFSADYAPEPRVLQSKLLMTTQNRITLDPKVLLGKPVVRGTRISVDFVLDLLARGWSEAEICAQYPGLERDDILACCGYAAALLRGEKVYPLPA